MYIDIYKIYLYYILGNIAKQNLVNFSKRVLIYNFLKNEVDMAEKHI